MESISETIKAMPRFDYIAAYMLANRKNGAIYAGSTADLVARVHAHKTGTGSWFTSKYGCTNLVWYERFDEMAPAIAYEKRLKRWSRQWKIDLIESINPNWDDLALF